VRPWFERRFGFGHLGEADFPFLLERLRGAPARVEEKVRDLARELLTRRDGEAWSIQEHVGHLVDLDALHAARLDDYRAGASVLRAADLATSARPGSSSATSSRISRWHIQRGSAATEGRRRLGRAVAGRAVGIPPPPPSSPATAGQSGGLVSMRR
jgi:hypothetical protein